MDRFDAAVSELEARVGDNLLRLQRSQSKVFSRIRMEQDLQPEESYSYDFEKQQILGTVDGLVHTVGFAQVIGTYSEHDETFHWGWVDKRFCPNATKEFKEKLDNSNVLKPLTQRPLIISADKVFDFCIGVACSLGYLGVYPISAVNDLVMMIAVDLKEVGFSPEKYVKPIDRNVSHLHDWCNLCGAGTFDRVKRVHCGYRADVCVQCAEDVIRQCEETAVLQKDLVKFLQQRSSGADVEFDYDSPECRLLCIRCGEEPHTRVVFSSATSLCMPCAKIIVNSN